MNMKLNQKFKNAVKFIILISGFLYATDFDKLFKKKNSFKGKIGIFDIKNNKINHRLNFYQVDNGLLKEIF